MKKIFDWIKTNLLGLEKPRRKRLKSARKVLKKRKPVKAVKKIKVKKAAVKVRRSAVKPAAKAPVKTRKALPAPVKPVKKTAAVKAAPLPKDIEKKTGVITHFFPNVRAAIVKMTGVPVEIGDEIHFKGPVTDFKIKVLSMQMNRVPILVAEKGQEIGIQVPDKVREGDLVFKVFPKKG